MNRKGFFMLSPVFIISVLIGLAAILILGIVFKNSINDGLLALSDFLSTYGIWIFVGTLVLIFKQPIIDFLYFAGAMIKRVF